MDITAATYRMAIYKNLVHTSTMTAVHNLTSDSQNIEYFPKINYPYHFIILKYNEKCKIEKFMAMC